MPWLKACLSHCFHCLPAGGASRGGRYTPFSRFTTIHAGAKTSRRLWLIRCGRKPRHRRLILRSRPTAEPAEFRATATSSKLWALIIFDGGRRMGLRKPKSIKHNGKSLAEMLEAHERFFSGKE